VTFQRRLTEYRVATCICKGTVTATSVVSKVSEFKKTQVNSKVITKYTGAIGMSPGASRILLFLDGDDTGGGLGSSHNNWQDKEDNHGATALA